MGVTNVEKVVRIGANGAERLYWAKLDCFVDLGPRQKGAHMSRFEEVVNDAIGEVVLAEQVFRAETLAMHIAERVRDRQGARRAEVRIEARYPEHKPAPVSGIETQEIYTLLGTAVASEAGTRRLIGVRAQGITACPCAQGLVQARSRERLLADGFCEDEIARIFAAVPVATHNQRGLGTLHIGCPEDCADRHRRRAPAGHRRGLDVLGDLRADEALRRGRRRREGPPPPALRRGLRARVIARRGRRLPRAHRTRHFVYARQENLETIHQHNVVAERYGLLGELRREIASGEHVEHHVSTREWLDGRA